MTKGTKGVARAKVRISVSCGCGMSSFQRGKAYSLLERGSRRAQNSLELLKIVSEYVPVGLECENSK